jgi:alpha/beta superfamily hydrolase
MTKNSLPPSPLPDLPEELAQKIDEDMGVLVLVSGTLVDGKSHYAYASIPPTKYHAFKAAQEAGNYDLSAFGEILAHGEGLNPPPHIRQKMEEDYGANHYFEEELEALMQKINEAIKQKSPTSEG